MVATEAVTDTEAATADIVAATADIVAAVASGAVRHVAVAELAAVVADAVNRLKANYQARPY
jgi:hypothetical protein